MLSLISRWARGKLSNGPSFLSDYSIRSNFVYPLLVYRFSGSKGEDLQSVIQQGIKSNSEEVFQQLLLMKGSEPFHGQILFNLGDLHYQAKDYQKAFNQFAKSIKKDPKMVQSYLKIAAIIELEGDTDYAIEVVESGLVHLPGNEQLKNKLNSLFGEDNSHFKNHLQNQNVNDLQKSQGQPLQNLEKQSNKVETAKTEEKILSSEAEFLEILTKDPKNMDIILKMKDFFISQDKLIQGKSCFEDLAQKYDCFELNFGTGVFFLESGDTSAAKPYLQKAYESDQMHYQVNLFLGIVALKEKDFDQAIKYFQKSVEIRPEQSDGLTNLGLIYVQLRQNSKAKERFQGALRANPRDNIALSSLATLQITEGALQEGLANLRRALEMDPSNQTTRSNLASTFFILGEHQQAERLLNTHFCVQQ